MSMHHEKPTGAQPLPIFDIPGIESQDGTWKIDLIAGRLQTATVPQPVRLPRECRIPLIRDMEPNERGFVRPGVVVIDGAERVWCNASEIVTTEEGQFGCNVAIRRTDYGVTLRVPNKYKYSRASIATGTTLLPVLELEFFEPDEDE